ncbi:MAG: hypothetical protein WCR02_08135 [Sphaerochaetaceae bacterium]
MRRRLRILEQGKVIDMKGPDLQLFNPQTAWVLSFQLPFSLLLGGLITRHRILKYECIFLNDYNTMMELS